MNESHEAREAQAELAAEREHVQAMRTAAEKRAWAEAGVMLSQGEFVKAKAFVLNAVALAAVLFTGLGSWYVIADVL